MAVKAGPSPFRANYPEFAKKSKSKKNLSENWALQGWREKPKKPEMRKLQSSLGNAYQMPGEDLDKFLTFMKSESQMSKEYSEADSKLLKNVQTPADYIDFVFNEDRLKRLRRKQVVSMDAHEGHIKKLVYNGTYMLLKVTFWNDTICCFFNVPPNVVQYLMHLAENNTLAPRGKDGKVRHALGVEFWNLIRIRGTVHGTRYPFEYTQNNNNGPREAKYEYTKGWSDQLNRIVNIRIDRKANTTEADTRLQNQLAEERQAAKALDRIYDYSDEDLVTFFENGLYDQKLAEANSIQRKTLQRAYKLYEDARSSDDIVNLLRSLQYKWPRPSELHAQWD